MTTYVPWINWNGIALLILSTQGSGIARVAVSFSGVILKNKESLRMCHSLTASTFLIAALEDGNLFWDKYKNMSLK